MPTFHKYRLRCTTESKYVYVDKEDGLAVPTTCPNDVAHTVDTTLTTVTDTYSTPDTLPHGEMYVDANLVATTINDQNQWERVSAGVVDGLGNGVDLPSDVSAPELVVLSDGIWQLVYSASLETPSASQTFEQGIGVNVTQPTILAAEIVRKTVSSRRYSSSDVGTVAGSAVLSLSANDRLAFCVRNLTSSANITVKQLSVHLHRLV